MSGRERFLFALRAFIATTLAAYSLATLWYFIFDMSYPEDVGRYAFWSLLLAGFVGIFSASWGRMAAWPRLPRVAAASFIGLALGFVFCLIAAFPAGLILRRIDVPVMLIWPAAGLVGVAFAASEAMQMRGERSFIGSLSMFAIGIVYVLIVKVGLNQVAEPLDFARYKPPEAAPRLDKPFVQQAKADAHACRDTVPVRSLASYGVALDSATAVTPLGVFSNVQAHADGKLYGRKLILWKAGPDVTGIAESYAGADPTRAFIEVQQYKPEEYILEFTSFYDDGYFDQFRGKLYPGSVAGDVSTAQAECANEVVDRQTITLVRDSVASRQMAQPRTLRELAAVNKNVFRRVPQPTYPDPPAIDGTLSVAAKYWTSDDMSAGAYTARFANSEQMRRWLDLERNLVFAKTEDSRNLIASWIAIAPSDALRTYTSALFKGYSAKDGLLHLSYSKVPIQIAN